MADITQDVIIINDFAQERRRTTSKGTSSRYTLTIEAEPIMHDLSETHLGEGPAETIAAVIKQQIKGITAIAAPSTLLKRRSAAKALAKGTPYAVKRYSGGRTGTTAPSGSVRLFNDSGRLADGILVKQNPAEKNWTINVTANRLDPRTFRNQALFLAMLERLAQYVPVLRKPLDNKHVVEAIEQGISTVLINKLAMGVDATKAARAELTKARLGALRAALSLVGI
jgi:hypothetical protein